VHVRNKKNGLWDTKARKRMSGLMMKHTFRLFVNLSVAVLALWTAGCVSAPIRLDTGNIPDHELKVQRLSKPCAVRVNAPRELSFSTSSLISPKIYNYDGRDIIEQIFQKYIYKRYVASSGMSGAASLAEVDVYKIEVEGSGSVLTCNATMRCILRDYQKTIVFNKVYKEKVNSPFNGITVPNALKDAVSMAARQFVADIADDPNVANSFCGGTELALDKADKNLPRIAVLPFGAVDKKLQQVEDNFVSAFVKLGFDVLSANDRDKVIKEQGWSANEMVGAEVDSKQMIEFGKLLSARYLVTGNSTVMENTIAVNARIIDAQTGMSVASESSISPSDPLVLLSNITSVSLNLKKQLISKLK
jgi:TolB-like protein